MLNIAPNSHGNAFHAPLWCPVFWYQTRISTGEISNRTFRFFPASYIDHAISKQQVLLATALRVSRAELTPRKRSLTSDAKKPKRLLLLLSCHGRAPVLSPHFPLFWHLASVNLKLGVTGNLVIILHLITSATTRMWALLEKQTNHLLEPTTAESLNLSSLGDHAAAQEPTTFVGSQRPNKLDWVKLHHPFNSWLQSTLSVRRCRAVASPQHKIDERSTITFPSSVATNILGVCVWHSTEGNFGGVVVFRFYYFWRSLGISTLTQKQVGRWDQTEVTKDGHNRVDSRLCQGQRSSCLHVY